MYIDLIETISIALGPLVLPLIGAGSDLIQSGTAAISQGRANRQNMELAKYQYSQELANWNRQNEYNSPKNQMARFKEAGLNPNLIYGQGTTGNATQLPKYNAPTMKANKGINLGGQRASQSYQQFRLQEAQVENVQAMTNLTNTKEGILARDYGWQEADHKDKVNKIQAQIASIKENTKLTTEKINNQLTKDELDALDVINRENRNELQEMGLNANDPFVTRMIYWKLKSQGYTSKEIFQKMEEGAIKTLWETLFGKDEPGAGTGLIWNQENFK